MPTVGRGAGPVGAKGCKGAVAETPSDEFRRSFGCSSSGKRAKTTSLPANSTGTRRYRVFQVSSIRKP
jgi:hypothetical protein